ncbi:hypothetical protein QQG55_56820 [Brugia pahangi]
MDGTIKGRCWIRIDPYHRTAMLDEHGTRNCSQTFRQHQLCLIENISYDNSSDAFSVRLKLYRCRKMQTM